MENSKNKGFAKMRRDKKSRFENKASFGKNPDKSKTTFVKPRKPETKPEWPMRINKYLAHQKLCTRKEADQLIAKGLVSINGKIAVLGDKINKDDKVTISPKRQIKKYIYFAYNKPEGIATLKSTPDEKDIYDVLSLPKDVFPVGRLDKQSSGLLILTNDGRVTDALLNPLKKHDKEYAVTCNRTVPAEAILKMSKGMKIERERTRPAVATKTGDKEFTIVLTEGKKHQVRRMAVACGLEVPKLVRTRVMNIKLDKLDKGIARPIEGTELKTFLTELELI
jgi:23S rRNA pseudouridine2604 synthase